jgi:anthranilate phosphoribosyltransferase
MQNPNFQSVFNLLQMEKPFNYDDAKDFIDYISSDKVNEYEIAALTATWKIRGENSEDLFQMANYLLSKIDRFDLNLDLIDCCGTGGDHSGSFNFSTASAIVAAACGAKVVKHGGRKTSSLSGSIDFLEALEVPLFRESSQHLRMLTEFGLTFVSSPLNQKLLSKWKQVCKKLNFGGQTGLLGTITNPFAINHQVLGVSKSSWGALMIDVMKKFKRKKAVVVYGEPGLDELSYCGTNHLWILEDGVVRESKLVGHEFGQSNLHSLDSLKGGDPAENAKQFHKLLSGKERGPILETLLLNAALVLWVYNISPSIQDAIALARKKLLNGHVKDYWEAYLAYARTLV